jgi:hypothetical protein
LIITATERGFLTLDLRFGDMPLEDAIARAIPHFGWLAEVAPEHFLVRRVQALDPE